MAGIVLSAVGVGCKGGTPGLPGATHDTTPQFIVQAAPTGIYLGAAVNTMPNAADDDRANFANLETETEAFETTNLGRRLALHVEYRNWSDLTAANLAADDEIQKDIQYGRVPVISLHCADDLSNPAVDIIGIANHKADPDLGTIRNGLASLVYPPSSANHGQPYPVMLRWFWEFNDNIGWPPPSPAPNGNDCYEKPSPGQSIPDWSVQFTNAWYVIHDHLAPQSLPAVNIAFVWNPSVVNSVANPTPPEAFYPTKPGYVDWIAGDGYDLTDPNTLIPLDFDGIFHKFVNTYSTYGRPIMLTENAACQEYITPPYDQADYLQNAQSILDNDTVYSNVKAYGYFHDTNSNYRIPPGNVRCTWVLNPNPIQGEHVSGMQAFANLAKDANFAPFVHP